MSENHSGNKTPLRVRPAREGDLEAVAATLVAGFHNQFAAALGEHIDRAERIVARTLALEVPLGLPGLYVAEVAGRVAGTIALRRQGQSSGNELESWGILLQELGLWRCLRAMVHFSLLDQPCGRREVYVSDVAVAAEFRRQGVGRALMRQAEQVARSWNQQALVLDVSARNQAARQMYRQMGYEEQRLRRSLLGRWLLQEGEWVRMRKVLR